MPPQNFVARAPGGTRFYPSKWVTIRPHLATNYGPPRFHALSKAATVIAAVVRPSSSPLTTREGLRTIEH
jgi:hypothetical protein